MFDSHNTLGDVYCEYCNKRFTTSNEMDSICGGCEKGAIHYWDLLNAHDWLYAMSDDRYVYRRGNQQREKLMAMLALSPEHKKLFEGFMAWNKGVITGKGGAVKPEKPGK